MKKSIIIIFSLALSAFQNPKTLKGTWEFVGGIYNGKKEGATTDYSLQRKYNATHYEAFLVEKGSKSEKFEAGDYVMKNDTLTDMETYCKQLSDITNIPIHYWYSVKNDTLTIKGKLPSGMQVEEYWKKVK
jgi:hypothetical protein